MEQLEVNRRQEENEVKGSDLQEESSAKDESRASSFSPATVNEWSTRDPVKW